MDDDDDDMADLFSFGTTAAAPDGTADANATGDATGTGTTASVAAATTEDDAFLDLIDSADMDAELLNVAGDLEHDQETQDILDWLDDDDDDGVHVAAETSITGTSSTPASSPKATTPAAAAERKAPTPPPPAPTFLTLEEALESPEATRLQIQQLFQSATESSSSSNNSHTLWRPALYCRIVCGKTLATVQASSMADSYATFVQEQQQSNNSTASSSNNNNNNAVSDLVKTLAVRVAAQARRPVPKVEQDLHYLLQYHHRNNKNGSSTAATRIPTAPATADTTTTTTAANTGSSRPNDDANSNNDNTDPLIPMVIGTLLSTGMDAPSCSVVQQQWIPVCMPLLALKHIDDTNNNNHHERWTASCALHYEFYLLCCYHLPLLVTHLDRHVPGWYWPTMAPTSGSGNNNNENNTETTAISRDKRNGRIPPSWLISWAAGESPATSLPVGWLLQTWDSDLVMNNGSPDHHWYFRLMALLELAGSDLLLLTGDELLTALDRALDVSHRSDAWLAQWWPQLAQPLLLATPTSVLQRLALHSDAALQDALQQRQRTALAAAQAEQAAQAQAHRQAQLKKAQEARDRLTRARLLVYYRKHAPDKEDNIDKIMDTYREKGWDVLDRKLVRKYGESFNPAVHHKNMNMNAAPPTNHATTNSNNNNNNNTKNNLLATITGRNRKTEQPDESDLTNTKMPPPPRKEDKVSVFVNPDEVLPVICWSKKNNNNGASTAATGSTLVSSSSSSPPRRPLKFYLVDSRSEQARASQGQFPTAVAMGPDVLMDPEQLQIQEQIFESLRGAVHVCVMGEGFGALAKLYAGENPHDFCSPKLLEQLTEQDEARTNNCALWFVKKGFPFVSVLDGGFCAAHSWLVRHGGPEYDLKPSTVLVDYQPESLFGQLERLHNSSASEKAQRKMTTLLDKSLTVMTMQVESIAADLDEGRNPVNLRKLFQRNNHNNNDNEGAANQKPQQQETQSNGNTTSTTTGDAVTTTNKTFKMPEFGGIRKALERTDSEGGTKATKNTATAGETSTTPSKPTPAFKNPLDTGKFRNPFDGAGGPNKFSNPFARKDAVAAVVTKNLAPASESDAATTKQQASNPFGRFRKAVASSTNNNSGNETSAPSAASTASSALQGLGAAINARKSMVTEAVEDPKRNPFRFGGGGTAKPERRAPGFGGFKNLMQQASSVRKEDTSSTDTTAASEESISFDT